MPGPPPVVMYIKSKLRRANVTVNINATIISPLKLGKVTLKNSDIAPAPSTLAASYSSCI